MKKFSRILSLLLLVSLTVTGLWGCRKSDTPGTVPAETQQTAETVPASETAAEIHDYASELKLDMNSETVKQEVTVKSYVDGDTVHFFVPKDITETGVLKARFLAVDTPESTGKIEEYGKAASRFTREKLSAAASIIIESDDSSWNLDSTGGRYLVWVWYQPAEGEDYRNLNIELLHN